MRGSNEAPFGRKSMSARRWRSQSLTIFKAKAGSRSRLAKAGILPAAVVQAVRLNALSMRVVLSVRNLWHGDRGETPAKAIAVFEKQVADYIAALRASAQVNDSEPALPSAIHRNNLDQATQTDTQYGSMGKMALDLLDASSTLAQTLVDAAHGKKPIHDHRPQLEMQAARLRVSLHVISEQLQIPVEASTDAYWRTMQDEHAPILDQVRTTTSPEDLAQAQLASIAMINHRPANSAA